MPTPAEIHAAALDLIGQTLASEAGPDGKPSVRARKKAKRIMDMFGDPEAMAALAEEDDASSDRASGGA